VVSGSRTASHARRASFAEWQLRASAATPPVPKEEASPTKEERGGRLISASAARRIWRGDERIAKNNFKPWHGNVSSQLNQNSSLFLLKPDEDA